MFINDQYLLNQQFYFPYLETMENMYYSSNTYDADTLMVMLVGA